MTPATTPPPRRRLPAAQRERQVLDAAVRVFARIGFHDASMDDVAEQAGVSKPMVYTHGGGSKDELLRRCIRRESDRLLTSVSQAAGVAADRAVPDVAERLRRGLRAYFATLTTHGDGWSVLYRQARTGALADEVHDARGRIVARVAALLATELALPVGTGPAPVAEPVAAALVGAAEGLADWSTAGGTSDPDELAAMVMALLWPGLDRLRAGPGHGPGSW